MEFPKDKQNSYIKGYKDVSNPRDPKDVAKNANKMLGVMSPFAGLTSEDIDKKEHNYANDRIRQGSTPTDIEALFKYSLDKEHTMFEDPTYLGYVIKFDTEMSPLWNYGDFPPPAIADPLPKENVPKTNSSDVANNINNTNKTDVAADRKTPEETEQESIQRQAREKQIQNLTDKYTGSAYSFIRQYNNIPEIADRELIWYHFLYNIQEIFGRTLDYNKWEKSYYIESIIGLEKLTSKMIKYGDDKLTITLTEDVSLRSSYLAELYNNLCYSYKNQRYLLPENTLRFDLMIEISDIRVFKMLNPKWDGDTNTIKQWINNDPPRMVYTLHDCNFDFFNSKAFEDAITMGGRDRASKNATNLSFDIKYKSVSKEFKSTLIPYSVMLSNKRDQLVNNNILSQIGHFDYIKSSETIKELNTRDERSQSDNIAAYNPLGNVKTDDPTVLDKLQRTASQNLNDAKDDLIDRVNNIRGTLINDILRQVREPFNMPRIYPDNVYNPDFRKLSIENFVRGLGSDTLNILENTARGGANDALRL